MRRIHTIIFAIILFVLQALASNAQKLYFFDHAKDMVWGSKKMLVFKVPKDSVEKYIYIKAELNPTSSWLQKPLFVIEKDQLDSLIKSKATEAGYYIGFTVSENTYNVHYRRKVGLTAELLKIHYNNFIEVKDENGKILKDVSIIFNGKQLTYDTLMRAFPIQLKKKRKVKNSNSNVSISKGNDIIFFDAYHTPTHENSFFRGPSNHNNYYNINYNFKGYLVTNKPNYLPLDTLKYKGYLLDPETNEAITETMDVYVENNYKQHYIHTINAQAMGVYYNEFVIGDSLLPDQNYQLLFKGQTTGTQIRQQFKIEDYLLDDSYLKVSTEGLSKYQAGDSIHLYAYAYNINNLPLIDAQLEVILQSYKIKIKNNSPTAFIPDTLWHKKMDANVDGDTHIGISTADFPNLDSIALVAKIILRTANNEIKDTTINLSYLNDNLLIDIEEQNNQLIANIIKNKQAINGKGYYEVNGIFKDSIVYPFQVSMDYTDIDYSFYLCDNNGSVLRKINHLVAQDQINIQENYVGDTASFYISNPRNIGVRYALYKGNNLQYYAYATADTIIKAQSKNGQTFTLIANYNWQRKNFQKESQAFKFSKKMMIKLNKSDIVFPGQKDSIHINLHDVNNKGIKNTNVTVLAFNAKFKEDFVPRFASSGMTKEGLKSKKYYSIFSQKNLYSNTYNYFLKKDWQKVFSLDTNFFYQKIYNDTSDYVIYAFNTDDTQYAQFAVYIKEGHSYVEPELIYINHKLSYISKASLSSNPHAQKVFAGKNLIEVRTKKAKYSINNLVLPLGVKTNIFINGDSIKYAENYDKNLNITKRNENDSLNHFEKSAIANSLFYLQAKNANPFYIKQNNKIYYADFSIKDNTQAGYTKISNNKNGILSIGPLELSDSIQFFQQLNTKTKLKVVNGFYYSLSENEVRMINDCKINHTAINSQIDYNPQSPKFNFVLQNTVDFDTLKIKTLKDYFAEPNYQLRYFIKDLGGPIYITQNGNVSITLPDSQKVKSLIFLSQNNKNNHKVFDGIFSETASFKLDTGTYKLYVLWADSMISKINTVNILAKGHNIINLDIAKEKFNLNQIPNDIKQSIQIINNGETIDKANAVRIYGRVLDDLGLPLEGATILIKNTSIGTIADEEGYFSLDVAIDKNEIIIEYFGFKNFVQILDNRPFYNITLYENVGNESLEAVAVFGQKIDRRSYTGSVNTVSSYEIERRAVVNAAQALSGSVPGVTVTTGNGQPGTSPDIMLRGMGSLSAESRPLIIVDGAPYAGDINNINTADIAELSLLKDATSSAVYGARAVNGVLLIETKGGNASSKSGKRNSFLASDEAQQFIAGFMDDMQAASGIRTDFRDWAIWEPNLWTDKNGNVSFEVQYPGTASSWKTYVLAMNPDGYSISSMYNTKAFKPLGASLAQPRFLRYGDSVEIVGNVLNYTQTAFELKTIFKTKEDTITSDFNAVKSGKKEKLMIAAPAINTVDTTSITNTFAIETQTGYTDGEEITIPVFPVGLIERKGIFTHLKNDTTFSTSPNLNDGHFTGVSYINIDGSLLDVMMQEIENLKEYPHGCTEQITSKLLSIHYEETIKKLTNNKDFNNTKTKRKIINKIIAAQNRDGSFGWFSSNEADLRVTNYVVSTLSKINTDGFLSPSINQGLNYLKNNINELSLYNKIATLSTLSEAKIKMDYAAHIAYMDTSKLDYYNKFAVLKIKKEQKFDYKIELDSLIAKANVNENGISWGTDSYDWYRNQLATTLLAYQLIKDDTAYANTKNQIIDYLLFKRRKGAYQNTAESGLVLSTLLPELIVEAQKKGKTNIKSEVQIKGSHTATINTFPQTFRIKEANPTFEIKKTGIAPVYAAITYEFFNPEPVQKDGAFVVSSTFKHNKDTIYQTAKHGEEITLVVKVEATKDADYVLIDVPIPAGCVPVKQTTNNYLEASRANFKDKTSIYCNSLKKGVYYFEIKLQARFKGSFNISPASASMMYYPDEQGNTASKKIRIQ